MKKNRIALWAWVLVFGMAAGAVQAAGLITDRELRRDYSDRVNRSLPKMIDADTRLDTTSAGPGRLLTYFYTLMNQDVANINVEEFSKGVLAGMMTSLCNGGDWRNVLANGITIRWSYKDRAGQPVADVDLTRETCGI